MMKECAKKNFSAEEEIYGKIHTMKDIVINVSVVLLLIRKCNNRYQVKTIRVLMVTLTIHFS